MEELIQMEVCMNGTVQMLGSKKHHKLVVQSNLFCH